MITTIFYRGFFSKLMHCCLTCSSQENIINIINNFCPNKAHGYAGISVSMLKLCAVEAAIPLQIIFQDCINSGIFPDSWKYANVQPIHKKTTARLKVTIDPSHCYPFVVTFLRKLSSTKFMLFWTSITCCQKTNLVLDQVIRRYTNFYPLHHLFMTPLKIMTRPQW